MSAFDITGSESFAEHALDIYEPNKRVSDELRELMPSSEDLLAEIRRHVPVGTELMQRTSKERHVTLVEGDISRAYHREKFYVRVFLDHEYVIGRSVDMVRRACFDGARLVGERLAERIDYCGTAPMTVRFTAEPMNLLGHATRDDNAFACLDPVRDRIVFHFGSYFVVCPPGEEQKEPL